MWRIGASGSGHFFAPYANLNKAAAALIALNSINYLVSRAGSFYLPVMEAIEGYIFSAQWSRNCAGAADIPRVGTVHRTFRPVNAPRAAQTSSEASGRKMSVPYFAPSRPRNAAVVGEGSARLFVWRVVDD
ncbi:MULTISPECIES: hypothetical protein [unclassified Desulfovibrio]|uniref:hypothetical protein n=1 Tax=unclassified Desulfovibrio TaxID=2593640 RepID=UPI002FD8BC3D